MLYSLYRPDDLDHTENSLYHLMGLSIKKKHAKYALNYLSKHTYLAQKWTRQTIALF